MPELAKGQPELPNANEFSPGQVSLRKVLQLAALHAGNRAALVEDIRVAYYSTAAARRATLAEQLKQQQTRANNVVIGMKEYGLFDLQSNRLTDAGKALLGIASDPDLYDGFARHILQNCQGMAVLDAVRGIQQRRSAITKLSLASELRQTYGFRLPSGTTRHQILLNWLRLGGLVGTNYIINDGALRRLTGFTSSSLDDISKLSHEQVAFLRTLRRQTEVHGTEFRPAQAVYELAVEEHGAIFREDQLRSTVYVPLERDGWVTLRLRTTGRGGKSGEIAATSKLLAVNLDLITAEGGWGVPSDLRPRLNTPLDDIFADLGSGDTYVKGIALELLAVRVAVAIGLTPVRFRERGADTGGAEVDLIAEGAHLHFSRWLFQCKNTPRSRVDLAALAKEVGLAVMLRAHVIVMVTTGQFASTVISHADSLADTSHLQTVLLDRDALAAFRSGGDQSLLRVFREQAAGAMRLKRPQITNEP